jgi:uncharacterized protein
MSTVELTREQIATYRATAVRRRQQMAAEEAKRRQEAWAVARRVGELLKEEFGASKVVVFGSLARPTGFSQWSDIDVAAWGIAEADVWPAMWAAQKMSEQFEVNLVDVASCRPNFLAQIEQEGVIL